MIDPVGGIDPAGLLGTVIAFRDRMRDREDEVNGLNVFPVPDGDTGTNVLLTLEAALAAVDPALAVDPDGTSPVTRRVPAVAVDSRPDPLDLPTLCEVLTRGIILGARGSSGVILSQAFVAGLSVIATSTEPASKTIAAALERARAAAYDAVAQPVEGTILTVLSAAAAAAAEAADLPLPDQTELVALEARAAVARTPVLLPVLAKAGVVDSGGRALSYGFDALAQVVGGRPLPPPPPVGHAVLTPSDADEAALRAVTPQGGGRYEVVASLSTTTDGAEQVRTRWRQLGDAVVVSGAGLTWRGHVHTDDPDLVLAAAREALGGGDVVGDVTVTDLHAQIAGQARQPRATLTHADGAAHPQTGGLDVVAVVEGPGMVRAYTELGARVVAGEAAPSVQELLEAVDAAGAEDVVLLPNDSNVAPAAAQAAALAHKRVHVLPARHALAGLAALVALDPVAPLGANLEAMQAALARTRAGRVAPVVRDSVVAIGPVHPGQWIAIAERQAVGVGDTPLDAALALVHHLCTPATELLTIAWGTAATEEQAEALQERVSADSPEDVIDVFDGGHHDAFWISAEDMPDGDAEGTDGEGATDQS